jgi:hypothetical protein
MLIFLQLTRLFLRKDWKNKLFSKTAIFPKIMRICPRNYSELGYAGRWKQIPSKIHAHDRMYNRYRTSTQILLSYNYSTQPIMLGQQFKLHFLAGHCKSSGSEYISGPNKTINNLFIPYHQVFALVLSLALFRAWSLFLRCSILNYQFSNNYIISIPNKPGGNGGIGETIPFFSSQVHLHIYNILYLPKYTGIFVNSLSRVSRDWKNLGYPRFFWDISIQNTYHYFI